MGTESHAHKKAPCSQTFVWNRALQFDITACQRYVSRQTAACLDKSLHLQCSPQEADDTPQLKISGTQQCLVGVRGFELLTSCSQSRRATGLRYTPVNQGTSTSCLRPDTSGIRSLRFGSKVNLGTKNGGSCGIRTYDQLVKSQLLYQLS
ncbi:hypothetical protein KPSA3_02084 [Pseudomonas syringae pv. actinidiae]|uniref:Uncharacterized protein n=1 Tax=Pseudomonas syringae pv. actinidiae TaxID=103796 RepID=A0AAN4Q3B4_PSESF|nr:hypothetical protein KPSA3_02084 [Pseudomonas syringae pv. actinidiae]